MKFDDAVWTRWGKWLDAIKDDLQTAIADAEVFRTFARVTHENSEWIAEHQGWYFSRFVARCYSNRMAVAVRRQTMDNDSASLMRILSQIRACASEITFERYLRYFPVKKGRPSWQTLTFKSVCAPTVQTVDDKSTVSEAVVTADMALLHQASKQIDDYADHVLAQLDQRGFYGAVSFKDLTSAVEAFDHVAVKYLVLLTGEGYDSLKPMLQFNWEQVFDHPLREPKA